MDEGNVEALLFLPRLFPISTASLSRIIVPPALHSPLYEDLSSLSWTPVPPYLPTPSLCLLLKTFPCRTELLLIIVRTYYHQACIGREVALAGGGHHPFLVLNDQHNLEYLHEACRLNQAWLFTLHHLLHLLQFPHFIQGPRVSKRIACHTSTHLTSPRRNQNPFCNLLSTSVSADKTFIPTP